MFKLFTISALLYILYRISFPPKQLSQGKPNEGANRCTRKKINEEDYIEYEEVD